MSSSSRTGATCRSKCKASRSTQAKEEEEQKLDESTEKAVQELLAEWGVEELKAQPAVSSSSFKLLLARPKTKPALVPKPPAVAPPEHLLKQGTTFAKAFGELSSADIENWDLHTYMNTYMYIYIYMHTVGSKKIERKTAAWDVGAGSVGIERGVLLVGHPKTSRETYRNPYVCTIIIHCKYTQMTNLFCTPTQAKNWYTYIHRTFFMAPGQGAVIAN